MVLATRHAAVPADPDAQLLCDMDLSILGQPESVSDDYEQQIRREVAWVPERDFARGRAAVLSSFASRPEIFSLPVFRDLYEAQARRNLARSIAQAGGPNG